MICIVYTRLSEEQSRHGYSLPEQSARGRARARELGYRDDEIVEITDEMISGEIFDRPGLNRARALIQSGGVGHFITLDLDRFSRKLVYQLLVTDEIERAGTKIEFLTFEWQDTPEGRLFLSIRGAVAEWEKAKIRQRTIGGKRRKALMGKLPHWPGQYGYKYDKEHDIVEIDPQQAAVVQQIYRWYIEDDWSCQRIADALNAAGIPTARGGQWYGKTISRILGNPLYKGEFVVNKLETYGMIYNRYRPPAQRIRPRLRPPEEHITIPVPAIIDTETWERAQSVTARRRQVRPGHPKEFYLLGGLVRCGICGAAMVGYRHKSHNKQRWIRYYCCARKLSPEKYKQRVSCLNPLAPADALEAVVWGRVVEWLTDPELLIEQLKSPGPGPSWDELTMMEQQLQELESERDKILGLYLKDLLPQHEVESRLEKCKSREAFLRKRIAELQPRRAMEAAAPEPEDVRALTAAWSRRIADAAPEERRRMVRGLIESITVARGQITIRAHVAPEIIARAKADKVEHHS